ncbi:MAG TPA: thioredoxin family protein [Candidatus Sulfotelmatobacter sp.]|jgi:peroxiredoxin|nr:thioredoxin family protein [Candidatus Sulfotelmatobacter sp.]
MTRKALVIPLLAIAVATAPALADPLAIGSKAPMTDTKLKNVDGKDVTLSDVKGAAGTLVVFTCNHCPFAKAWETRIVDLGNAYRAKGIGVIAVNANDPKAAAEDSYEMMQQRVKDRGIQYPYVVDATSGLAKAFGATRTPEAFLFDRDGKLVYHGAIDDNAQEPDAVKARYLKDALDAVVGGKEVAVKETKSIGCGIKFRS